MRRGLRADLQRASGNALVHVAPDDPLGPIANQRTLEAAVNALLHPAAGSPLANAPQRLQ